MAISQANLFDLLSDDAEDDTVAAPEPSEKPVKAKKEAKEAKPAAAPVETKKPAAANAIEARMRGDAPPAQGGGGRGDGGGGRGGRGGGRGRSGGRSGEARPAYDASESSIDPVAVQQNKTVRGLRGGYAGPHAGRSNNNRRTDRHSSTSDHEVEKRHGAGKGNWGTQADTIEEGKQEATTEEAEGPSAVPANPEDAHVLGVDEEGKELPDVSKEEAKEEKPAPPPEPKEMSLDEYEKLQAEKRAALNTNKSSSKPTEVDMSDFKGMTRKETVTADAEVDVLELKNKKTHGTRKTGDFSKEPKAKETLPHNFQVGERPGGPSPGGGRGGRGPRGDGGGRGRDRPFSGGRGEGGPRGPPREGGDRPYTPRQGDAREGGRGGSFRGGRGDYNDAGRGRGRGAHAPAIDDSSAFPSLGDK